MAKAERLRAGLVEEADKLKQGLKNAPFALRPSWESKLLRRLEHILGKDQEAEADGPENV